MRKEKIMERLKRIICIVCIFVLSGVSGMEMYAGISVSGVNKVYAAVGEEPEIRGGGGMV